MVLNKLIEIKKFNWFVRLVVSPEVSGAGFQKKPYTTLSVIKLFEIKKLKLVVSPEVSGCNKLIEIKKLNGPFV